ncbi:hypothetical protein [Streptomyces europaeiscabiei]|uniref:hypothetical protein n=1 Tax=Streptomyces europaeiscabiei TaxID=146819 RepID=UPI0013C47D80|nr:hypothetical protein [Streptomyces europaeiscabiei]MDX2524487.1 hypothetical protein [Streptomyces europaeiscabiei]MDX2768024.1 hypothetical protein [Streptomyces europaeiscabiei]MDX3778274.1 hypothetical protein [Streptomyces europaeiscabiei]MDX3864973.1 hypothetical protein [Streptomyces europaeiscabiei]MDX3872438.1 hypothetical protein [Streptomyces europaeiscabiei]
MMATRKAAPRAVSVHALAGIRLFNGAAGLLAPELLIRRLDPDREPPGPAAVYAFPLFGIRTIRLGLDLLTGRDERLRMYLRDGGLIHGGDTATAATLGLSGRLPPRTATLTTLISAANTVLAATSLANPVKGKRK